MKKFSEWVMALLFSGTLLVLMAATILLPKERYSYYENRNLSAFPEISVESIANGKAFGELEAQLLSDFPACECIFSDPEHYVPLEGGESYAQLDVRCRKLLEEILPPLEGRFHDVVLVSHGAFIRGVVCRVLGLPLKDFWDAPPQPNCSCTVLELKNGVCTLVEEGRVYG